MLTSQMLIKYEATGTVDTVENKRDKRSLCPWSNKENKH